ncbi:hypothetical protein QBC44DRAFT_6803 [Cladorrhinum sp. PSN332]|nr:hypothetical protein QBC44DRAFT_6803 [Cladorrhinum sp. PSN332]
MTHHMVVPAHATLAGISGLFWGALISPLGMASDFPLGVDQTRPHCASRMTGSLDPPAKSHLPGCRVLEPLEPAVAQLRNPVIQYGIGGDKLNCMQHVSALHPSLPVQLCSERGLELAITIVCPAVGPPRRTRSHPERVSSNGVPRVDGPRPGWTARCVCDLQESIFMCPFTVRKLDPQRSSRPSSWISAGAAQQDDPNADSKPWRSATTPKGGIVAALLFVYGR